MNVTIFGWYHYDDNKFFDQYTQDNLKITLRCGIDSYTENTKIWHDVWSQCVNEDLVIIASFGSLISKLINEMHQYEPYFSKIKNVVYWSMDSHHDRSEKNIRKHFTHWLVAHRGYEVNTGPNTIHIPLCYWQNSYDNFVKIIQNVNRSNDVIFHHKKHKIGDRNDIVKQIIPKINELNLTYDFSYLYGGPDNTSYTRSLEGCRVGLNMSLLNDFNFRNFEVWMANKPLLTNYLTDFELFPELKENTTFYNRDLSDFKEKLQYSLEKKIDSRRLIIKDHMLTRRYIDMINLIMNTKFKITYPDVHI
jgi:hypothetical protein